MSGIKTVLLVDVNLIAIVWGIMHNTNRGETYK